jgi:hypothetical protein
MPRTSDLGHDSMWRLALLGSRNLAPWAFTQSGNRWVLEWPRTFGTVDCADDKHVDNAGQERHDEVGKGAKTNLALSVVERNNLLVVPGNRNTRRANHDYHFLG